MSTILDALKRLEKDGEQPEEGRLQADWLDAPSVKEPAFAKAFGYLLSRSRTFWAVCLGLICVVAILAALGTGLLPPGQPQEPIPEKAQSPGAAPQAVPEKPVAPVARRSPIGQTTAQPPPQRPAVKTTPAPAARIPSTRPTVKEAAQKPLPAAPAAGRASVGENAGEIAAKRTAPVRRPPPVPSKEEGPKAAETGGRQPSVESLPAAVGFALQAISWSEQPERRIAVVNGRILKEGEKIEDYSVVEINREDVIFRYRGQSWRLGFRER